MARSRINPSGATADLLEQSRLADARLPDDLHEATFPGARLLECGVEHRHLGVSAHEREPFQRGFARSRPRRAPHRPRLDGLGLALTANGSSRSSRTACSNVEHVGRGVDLVRACLGHQPRGEVHRVAHHRVRAPVERADVAGENSAAVHADAGSGSAARRRRSRAARAACAPRRRRCLRRPRGQDQLAAVDVDVGGEEATPCASAAVSTTVTSACSASAAVAVALALDQRVGALESDECDGHGTMLGQRVRPRTCVAQSRPTGSASMASGAIAGAGAAASSRTSAGGLRSSSMPGPFGAPTHPAGSNAAVSALTEISPARGAVLHRDQAGPRRAGRPATRDATRPPRRSGTTPECTPCDIRSVTFGAGQVDPADVAQHVAHQHGGAACARRVALAVEPQQQRVAAELEQAAAALVGDREHRLKTRPIASVICSAPSRPLRASCSDSLREARDIDEDPHAAFERPRGVSVPRMRELAHEIGWRGRRPTRTSR